MTGNLTSHRTSVAEGLALMLETACRDFETLDRIIRRETVILTKQNNIDLKSIPTIQMALAKSFIFYSVRAGRICEHGHAELNVTKKDRKLFLTQLKPILAVRDVNEHGFDPANSGRGKQSRPSMHHHDNDQVAVDETSLVIIGEKILMGPLNLYPVYDSISQMRSLAGWSSLTHLAAPLTTRSS
jgi:hypothetical protein